MISEKRMISYLKGVRVLIILAIVLGFGIRPEKYVFGKELTPNFGWNAYELRIDRVVDGDEFLNNNPVLAASIGNTLKKILSSSNRFLQTADELEVTNSTYFGGSSLETAYAVAVDPTGAVYVAGETSSIDFPQKSENGASQVRKFDGFLIKFSPDLNTVEFALILGGEGIDSIYALAVERDVIYVAGATWSQSFPGGTEGQGESDAWVAAISQDGKDLMYSVRFGGSDEEIVNGLVVQDGRATLTGMTYSSDYPMAVPHGDGDIFVTRLNQNGTVDQSILLGGSDVDAGFAIAEYNGIYLVCGQTWSRNFILRGLKGEADGFALLLDKDFSLISGSLIGGSGEDSVNTCAFSENGTAMLAGRTASSDMYPGQGQLRGENDAFLARMGEDGALGSAFSFGGGGSDSANGLIGSQSGRVWVTGSTSSLDFPTVGTSFFMGEGGDADIFIGSFDSSKLEEGPEFLSPFGGNGTENAYAIAETPGEIVVLVGSTRSVNFPLAGNSFYGQLNGQQDAFILALGNPQAAIAQPTVTLQSEVSINTATPSGQATLPLEVTVNFSTITPTILVATSESISETPIARITSPEETGSLTTPAGGVSQSPPNAPPTVPGRQNSTASPVGGIVVGAFVLVIIVIGAIVYSRYRLRR